VTQVVPVEVRELDGDVLPVLEVIGLSGFLACSYYQTYSDTMLRILVTLNLAHKHDTPGAQVRRRTRLAGSAHGRDPFRPGQSAGASAPA
jgi:hypothetical protein